MFAPEKFQALKNTLPEDKSLAARLFLPSVLPLGITAFYAVPALVSYLKGDDPKASTVLLLSVICTILYVFLWVSRVDVLTLNFIYSFKKKYVEMRGLAIWISAAYFVLMVYASCTALSIPLFDSLKGLDVDAVARARETFLRARGGFEVALNYMYSIFRSFLMPFAVCILYQSNSKFKHAVLVAFLFSLMLTLEKSLSVLALLPLFYLFAQKRNYKMAALIFFLTVATIGATSFLARGGVANNPVVDVVPAQIGSGNDSISTSEALVKSTILVPEKYNMFSGTSQVEYVLNRIFYIPYITAHEWIRYHHEVMNGEFTFGRSISIVAIILGEKKIYLERDIFNFQWGQNETATGSANTAYFIDAYLNFGVAGCFLYTLVIVCMLRLAIKSNIATLQACIFVPVIFLLFNSLTAMIFSGGLFFLVLLALFFSERNECPPSQGNRGGYTAWRRLACHSGAATGTTASFRGGLRELKRSRHFAGTTPQQGNHQQVASTIPHPQPWHRATPDPTASPN